MIYAIARILRWSYESLNSMPLDELHYWFTKVDEELEELNKKN